ncbi:MAG TPA: dephospho-CoA kinase [Gammaproteobacteria bacterium]
MLRIGLTGGIGCGKTAACRIFSELGIPVIDADQISREVVAPGTSGLVALTQLFGSTILTPEQELDRQALRVRIFADPALRKSVETILHPLIKQRMVEQSSALHAPYVILAIPLLLEAGWRDMVDRILVIDCPVETQIKRTMARDGISRAQVEAIIATQLERAARLALADDIVTNDSSFEQLREQINALHLRYLHMASAP